MKWWNRAACYIPNPEVHSFHLAFLAPGQLFSYILNVLCTCTSHVLSSNLTLIEPIEARPRLPILALKRSSSISWGIYLILIGTWAGLVQFPLPTYLAYIVPLPITYLTYLVPQSKGNVSKKLHQHHQRKVYLPTDTTTTTTTTTTYIPSPLLS